MNFSRTVSSFNSIRIFIVLVFALIALSNVKVLSQALIIQKPIGGETYDNKSEIAIKWKNDFPNKLVLLEYSIDNGKSWNKIDTSSGSIYFWSIPNGLTSNLCIIRISLFDKITFYENVLVFQGHSNWINTISLGRGTNLIASGGLDKTVKLWDKNDGKLLKTFLGHTNQVNSVSISFDKKLLVSGSSDSTIKIWNIESGENILTLFGHKDAVRCVDISSDNQFVVSSSNDSTIKIWNLNTGEIIRTLYGHEGWVIDVKYFNNSSILSGSSDKTVKLWNAVTGENLKTFSGHSNNVNSVCYTKDEKIIVSASSDNTIKMWNVETGINFRTLLGHTFHVVGVDFNHDNSNLLSCSFDSTVKIWDPMTGENIKTFKGHNGWVRDVQYDFNGLRIFSCGFDSVIRRWDKRFLYYNTISSLFTIKDVVSSILEKGIKENSVITFQNNQLKLNYSAQNESEISLKVIDLNGVIIAEYKNISSNTQIDLSNYTGLKIVVVENNGSIIEVKKIVIIN